MTEDQTDLDYSSTSFKELIAHAQAYGFIYPSSAIYDGLQSIYDYGPYGVLLKRRIQAFWWQSMTQLHQNIVGMDTAILMHPTVWKASGHVDGFTDPMVDHKDSKKRYRVDLLIEAHALQLQTQGKITEAADLLSRMEAYLREANLAGLDQLIAAFAIVCPLAKTANWTAVRQFNLMFTTQVGTQDDGLTLYLRPETAQGIFVNFLNVQKTARMKIPFGIAQMGKAFRNEIVARQFTFRMREFEQMEMQFFIKPGTEKTWFDYWTEARKAWYYVLAISHEKLSLQPHTQLAHYAKAALDIMYTFPFGSKEVEGIHSRTDFDLHNHAHYAKKKFDYFDAEWNQSYIPYVIETSAGLDRIILMLLANALTKEKGSENGKNRTYLKLPAPLAPIQAAIFPLVKKDGLEERAWALFNQLKTDFHLIYEDSASIGKRYARQDLIGTPYCITVDYQTLEDDTITMRERDSTQQHRMAIAEVVNFLERETNIQTLLRPLSKASWA